MHMKRHAKPLLFLAILASVTTALLPLAAFGQSWQAMPGKVTEIAAGGTDSTMAVWGLGPGGQAYKWDESSFSWQTYGGKADEIAVTADGTPWVVNDEQVYRLRGQNWQNMPGKARRIAAGGGEVWCLGEDRSAYRWNPDAFEWEGFGGTADEIAVTRDGTPWVVNDKQIYRLRGRTWQNMPGKAEAIGAGGGAVWIVGDSNQAFRWSEDAFSWQNRGGSIDHITVAPDGTPWALEQGVNGLKIYRLQ